MMNRVEESKDVIIDIPITPHLEAKDFILRLKEGINNYEWETPYGQSVVERYYLEILGMQLKYFKTLLSAYHNVDEYEGSNSILLAMNGMLYEIRLRIYANNPNSPLLKVFDSVLHPQVGSQLQLITEYAAFVNVPTLSINEFFTNEKKEFKRAVRRFRRAISAANENGYNNIGLEAEKLLTEIQQEQREDNLKFYRNVLSTATDYIYSVMHASSSTDEIAKKFKHLMDQDPTGKPSVKRLVAAISLVVFGGTMVALSVLGNQYKSNFDQSLRNSGIITGGGVFMGGLVMFSFNRKRSIAKKAENFDKVATKVSQFFSPPQSSLTETLLNPQERQLKI